jgi:hypothetical protein
MKHFYTLGEHITAADPRGFIKIGPRIIPNEILGSLQKLKEIKLFSSKEQAQQFALKNAKKDSANKVVSISSCIEVFIIDDTTIQKNNSNAEYDIAPNQMTNIIIRTASIDIPAAMNECQYKINDEWKKEIRLETYDYFGDAALNELSKMLHKDSSNMAPAVANYFNGYVQKGMKHSISAEELENKFINAAASLASAFYTIDHQSWAATIAKTLITNSQWDIPAVNKYLLEQRQNFFEDKKNDPIKSIFLKKLDGVIVILYEFMSEPKLSFSDDRANHEQSSTDTPIPTAATPLRTNQTELKIPSAAPRVPTDLMPPIEDLSSREQFPVDATTTPTSDAEPEFTISFAVTAAPFKMFMPVLPKEEKPVDQNAELEELFRKAKENRELAKFLLVKAKEFDNAPKEAQVFKVKTPMD